MNILIPCEYSGSVRDAFADQGHFAVSCDFLPSETPGLHYQGDVRDIIHGYMGRTWDMMIAFPPCTDLATSGARHFKDKVEKQKAALEFVRFLMDADIPRICIENPVGIIGTNIRPATQYIEPWQFGHGEQKKTGLWLKNLPKLRPTELVEGREQRTHQMWPSEDRWKERSRTYPGIAEAMAWQWGNLGENDFMQLTLKI